MLLYVFLVVIPLLWLLNRWKRMTHWKRLGVRGPKPNFINGNCAEVREKGLPACHIEWNRLYGHTYGYYVGGTPTLVVGKLELVKRILKDETRCFINRPISSNGFMVGAGMESQQLIFQKGDAWKNQRTGWKSFFNPKNIAEVFPAIEKIISVFMNELKCLRSSNKPVDIYKLYQSLTLDIISQILLGVKTNAIGGKLHPIMETFKEIVKKNSKKKFNISTACFPELDFITVPFLKLYELFKSLLGTSAAYKFVRYCRDISKRSFSGSISNKNNARNDFPIKMFQAGIAEEKTIADCFALFFGGFETISITLLHATNMLVKHPEIQNKLREELLNAIKSNPKEVLNPSDILELKYLDNFLKETLRCYNPVPGFIRRQTVKDYRSDELNINKNTVIQIPMSMIHQNEEFWSSPEIFNPDRYNNGEGHSDSLTFLPFGGGRRNCVAMHFALSIMKLTLATLLTNYNISDSESEINTGELPVTYSIIRVIPKCGIRVNLQKLKP